MNINTILRVICGSISLAIGLSFTLKYTGIALIGVIGNSHQALAVVALSVIIAGATLIKNRRCQTRQ